jgi:hypothetical protein
MLVLVSVAFLAFIIVLAVYMNDRDEERLRDQQEQIIHYQNLVTVEDSIHAYEDGF